jgi:hypothetical protein
MLAALPLAPISAKGLFEAAAPAATTPRLVVFEDFSRPT